MRFSVNLWAKSDIVTLGTAENTRHPKRKLERTRSDGLTSRNTEITDFPKAHASSCWSLPSSLSRRAHRNTSRNSGEIRPDVKPDYDNIAKIVSDALNKVAYDDDKSIVDSTQRKFYGENPRTIIILQEAKPLERSQI